MDIWEANLNAAAYTPHLYGCGFNSYRIGDQAFLGTGLTVDTSKTFTVVTQFTTSTATLSEIRRIYTNISGMSDYDSITDQFCVDQKAAFGDTNYFKTLGGLSQMGNALETGMVLSLSVWDDHAANTLWFDSSYPTNKSVTSPDREDWIDCGER
ncbi:concanavalin A-like lectin/glucanase domain-containing protein [Sphaerosporella brunnea]|uniref:Glucanase n=1 Tax=Sphaerosporella brunnea TaxID=1250544 RepID=A0A5J5EK03_9PEZI|nr:concanavalin A-like lectin/glucanase domain-containing protein [Sphaerosporella brunnea]